MNNDQKIKQICDNPDVNSLSWDEPKEKPKCIICGDILQGRDDDSSTTCRWCIQGWTENEPKQIKQICDNPDVNALQISSIEDLNELPLSSETQGEEDGSINTKSRVRGGAINIDNTNNNIHDSKLEETISITDKDGKVYKFEKDRLYNHRLFYVDINNKTVFGIANCSSVYWKEDGKCYNAYDSERLEVYDLTPIQKKWYEDENNFPALMITEYKEFTQANNKDAVESLHRMGWRLATQTEVNNLYFDKDN